MKIIRLSAKQIEEIMAIIEKARSKDKELKIRLKNTTVLQGKVDSLSEYDGMNYDGNYKNFPTIITIRNGIHTDMCMIDDIKQIEIVK